MKKIILFLILCIISLYATNAQEKKSYYNSGKLDAIQNYSNGKLHGVQKYYYENGQLSSIENYVNDKLEGEFKSYYEDGQLREIAHYLNDEPHGATSLYFDNGQLFETINYSYGKENGESKTYQYNGQPDKMENYSNGKQDGIQKSYFEGQLSQIVTYKDGIRNGEFKDYEQNGYLSQSGLFLNGKQTGEWKWYYKSNGKLKRVGDLIGIKETGLWKYYYESGRLKSTGTYSNGKLIGERERYPDNDTNNNSSKSGKIDKQDSMTKNHPNYNADANSFKSVKIGNQVWMSKNLNVSNFRNGDAIPQAKSKEEWEKTFYTYSPAWCYYENDSNNGAILGKLYNWYAVNDERGLAPLGWHIPSDDEWTELIDNLGGKDKAGIKMKSMSMWNDYNNIREKGVFEALPGGTRSGRGEFQNGGKSNGGTKGVSTHWWTSTKTWYRSLKYYKEGVDRDYSSKRTGMSVRCIKD